MRARSSVLSCMGSPGPPHPPLSPIRWGRGEGEGGPASGVLYQTADAETDALGVRQVARPGLLDLEPRPVSHLHRPRFVREHAVLQDQLALLRRQREAIRLSQRLI